jgi:glycosyltransferase involved in cell wall biosynthesis
MALQILVVTRRFPPGPGGVEYEVMEIARRLHSRGHEVGVYTSDLYSDIPHRRLSDRDSHLCDGIRIRRFPALPIPFRKTRGTSMTPTMLLACLVDRDFPGLVHAHGLNLVTISASLLAQQRRKVKVVCTTHLDPRLLSGNFPARILSHFDGIIALTQIEREFMLNLGLDGDKIRVIPNGINIQAFANLPSADYFRRKFGIKGHLILCVGRVDSLSKGCDVLIEAISLVQQRMGECVIVFAGPDWGSQRDLQTLSVRRRVRVVFTGNLGLDDLRAAFVACDVLALPSFVESLPISILEGMLCGAPVVASRVGGVPSIIHHEDTGLLVSPGNYHEIADAICRVLGDKRLSAHLGANARKLARSYSIERTVEQLEEFYGEISRH